MSRIPNFIRAHVYTCTHDMLKVNLVRELVCVHENGVCVHNGSLMRSLGVLLHTVSKVTIMPVITNYRAVEREPSHIIT